MKDLNVAQLFIGRATVARCRQLGLDGATAGIAGLAVVEVLEFLDGCDGDTNALEALQGWLAAESVGLGDVADGS